MQPVTAAGLPPAPRPTEDAAMPAEDPEGLDRRDFMMATLVSVGASAALAADAGPAKAQGARTAGRAAPSSPAT